MGRGNSSRRRARREKAKEIKREARRRQREHKRLAELRQYRNEHWSELTRDEKMCRTKKRYSSLKDATATLVKRSECGGGALRAYKCPICNGYHLSSTPLGERSPKDKEHSSEQF